MSFDRFVTSVQAAALVEVAGHWNAARGAKKMPAWRDIDPTALCRHLPIVWAWRYDPAQGTFIGRLAGETITKVIGHQIRGRRIDECFLPETVPVIRQRFDRILAEPKLMRSAG